MTNLIILIDIINTILSVIVLYIFFDIFFERKQYSVLSVISWFIFIIWHFAVEYGIAMDSNQVLIINIVIVVLLCLNNYYGSWLNRIIFPLLACALWTLIEFIIAYISILFDVDVLFIPFLGSFISKVIMLILLFYLRSFFQSVVIQKLPNNRDVIFLLLIPVGNLFVMYTLFMVNTIILQDNILVPSIMSSLIILIINIYIFKFYSKMYEELELKRYNSVYKKQLELINQHSRERETAANELKKSKHNMKQNLIYLRELAGEKKHHLMVEYLNQLFDETIKEVGISHTGNTVVDALVNYEYSVAKAKGIDFYVDLKVPEVLDFSNSDLCILLGNILDNALEAVLRDCKTKTPYIKLNIAYEKGALMLKVVNTFDGRLKRSGNGELISVKEDFENHGIGLKSIQKVVNKYHGTLMLKNTENEFALKILLYAHDKSDKNYS